MKTEKNRESGLELLRIIAIILIVSHHLVVHCPFDLWAEPFCLKRLFFQFFYRASGKIGIALFLLITVWFLADKEISLRQAAKKNLVAVEHPVFLESEFFGVAVYY